jgi:hypothetical protein
MSDCKTVYTPKIIVSEVDLFYFGGKTLFYIYCTIVKAIVATINPVS